MMYSGEPTAHLRAVLALLQTIKTVRLIIFARTTSVTTVIMPM